ncbi:nitroreductase family protein [Paucilactobacillus nenjiangensis]|jgi:predicted oxidoreductase (fatty acid repression mutant protein)|uniref:Nitroreductase family protein n=1 Tax=Paucilactobacillus nenjiangensis TaxID=1296540 RepID=A0A5P1X0Q3_9LACO|nr:nitroreductase family protein [Paucilactobacillus nenjiangensis]QER67396.1 nitroreductase family protein [Paucilactobacillus nenjiangensis]
MQTETLKLATQRRSIYALGKNVNASEDEVASVIKEAVRQAPTAFNSQTTRAVIAFGDSHDKVWDIVMETLRKIVPAESFASTEEKVNSFKAAFGTVLLFTDTDAVADLKENFPLYADNFDDFAEQGIGLATQNIWTVLAENKIGASNQHYNPLIDKAVQDAFGVPANWHLRSEMPFGSIEAPAGDKDFMDDADRFKVLK